jgi:hypothetical protein
VQHLYIPGLHVLREQDGRRAPPNQPEELVSNIRLYLPSAINVTSKVACNARLCRIECDLHQAQAHDALHELRDNLQLRSHVSIVCVKYLQTFSLSTNNNVCQHCSRENQVFANIPSGERAYFLYYIIIITRKKVHQSGLNTRPPSHGIIEHNTTHTTTKPRHHKI